MVANRVSTSKLMAKVHVAFSRKSAVLRTPITWFEEAKFDAKPPPFEFCTSTINVSRTQAIMIRIEKSRYIANDFYVYLSG